jgi:hypothetical protein
MNQPTIFSEVKWKDLAKLSTSEMIIENTITLPWLLASWVLAYFRLYMYALPCSFLFFLTALRQAHNGFYNSLGIGKRSTWLSLYVNSILMLASMHAVKFTHLRHHKYCLGEKDFEGKCARMKWWQAILYGQMHVFSIHKAALTLGNKNYRRAVIIEMFSITVFAITAVVFNCRFLIYHTLVMSTGEFFSAFFAVWTVHHDLDEHFIARTQRVRWKNLITYNMFYHLGASSLSRGANH